LNGLLIMFLQVGDHDIKRRYRQVQVSRKVGCPAKVFIYEHLRFPQYAVGVSSVIFLVNNYVVLLLFYS